jgi:hypothetical protein
MATIFDNPNAYSPAPEEDEALHNALIKERYRKLQNAEETQLSESISAAHEESQRTSQLSQISQNPQISQTYASAAVLAPERPNKESVYEPIGHTRVDSPLFTPEMLDKTIQANRSALDEETLSSVPTAPNAAPNTVSNVAPTFVEGVKPLETTAVSVQEESYSLNAFAIKMIAAFAAVVVVLLAIIGINSAIIRQKSIRLSELEEQKESLIIENAELVQRIFDATSMDEILKWADENDFVQADQ